MWRATFGPQALTLTHVIQTKSQLCSFKCQDDHISNSVYTECWTDWFDRDDPSGSGDWKTLLNLPAENKGKICPKPVQIEARTLTGVAAGATGNVIHKKEFQDEICKTPLYIEAVTIDTMTPAISTGETIYIYNPTQGFVCRNEDQKDGACHDYKVRFGCPCNEK
ncbi:cartilage intermediate layer protein 1-like [Antennarius striatus]|uniref:cartilage intermediate layer protein 1-like n=1 Tax=Antennarius striatus TaxID=241820 RepID=UPI0035B279B4